MAIDVISDEIIGNWSASPGVRIIELTGYKKGIPIEADKNIAGITATALLKYLGEEGRGLELKIHKYIQGGSGLGSSASSATAAAVLVNEMLDRPLEKRELIPFAMEGEVHASGSRHGDNIVPAMIGGLVLIRNIDTFDYHRIYTPPGLFMAIVLPHISIQTKTARDILQPTVPLHDMVLQAANLGSLVIGMQQGDLDLISRSLQDHVIEHQRKHLIPLFDNVKEKAMGLGALGCSISGAGPAIFALCAERSLAENVAAGMKAVYDQHGLDATSYVGGIQHEGTKIV
ncbi:MAG: homoserine kinase [Bacteroidota bacterium]|nr:homoserine kinase [Bacteroidota bacterium]